MIDGIISGKILLKPKIMHTRRGTPYLIAKMRIFGYQTGNITSPELHGDVIAFDAAVCRVLQGMDAGMLVSVCGMIVPVREAGPGGEETVLKITARGVVPYYSGRQLMGKGALFDLLARSGWWQAV